MTAGQIVRCGCGRKIQPGLQGQVIRSPRGKVLKADGLTCRICLGAAGFKPEAQS